MRHFTIIKGIGSVVEICGCEGKLDGALIGYAICFAGSWDAWKVQHPAHNIMLKVAIALPTRDEAVAAVVKEFDNQ